MYPKIGGERRKEEEKEMVKKGKEEEKEMVKKGKEEEKEEGTHGGNKVDTICLAIRRTLMELGENR